jgi:outer membrane protein OmpA-like peptidoglycan-associated protein
MRRFLMLCAFSILSSGYASAQQAAYSAEDVIKHFAAAKPAVTRGICLADDPECGVEPAVKPPSFDLLVTFEKNSADLTDAAQNNLLQFAMALRHPNLASLRFAVEGFTDASGADSYNMRLSQLRADSVVSYLTDLGVETARLQSKGYGETRMRMPDAMDPGNRRVETRIITE